MSVAHKVEEKPRTEDISLNSDHTFDSFLLSAPVGRGLQDAGFYKPSPIQVRAIPLGKCGLDLIVKAKSGTGKTLVFTIIALEMIKVTGTNLQVVVVAPTREIAHQIVDVIKTVGKHIEGLKVGLFIGGLSYDDDVKRAKTCHIAVGAPGRVKHLVEQNHLNLKTVKLFVLDEADKLMTEDFQSDINYFYHMLPEQKQFLAVSATMTNELNTFLERYMQSPTFVTPGTENSVLLGLRQFVSIVEEKSTVVQQFKTKIDELVRIFSQIPFTQCLVFSNYQQRTESISNILNQQGWKSLFITGAQSQEARLMIVDKLKKLECKILLTTDLTARGIDASNVDLVINYDIPSDSATYLHRMGRTGRYGSLGICITIASSGKELVDLQHILGDIGGSELVIAHLPSGTIIEDVWKCDLNVLGKTQAVVDEHRQKMNWKISDENSTRSSKKKNHRENKEVSKKFRNLSVEDRVEIDVENKHLESIEKLLKAKETKNEDISTKYANVSPESLLQSLAQGQLPEALTNSEVANTDVDDLISPADLYPWVPVEEPILTKTTGVSLLEDSDDSSFCSNDHLPLITTEILNKKITLAKNIALYHTWKILKSDEWDLDIIQEAVQPIACYFNVLKEETDVISNKLQEIVRGAETDEIYNKMTDFTAQFAEVLSSRLTQNQPHEENICQIAYDHIIKGTSDWRNIVGDAYKTKNKKPTYEETMDVAEEEEEEEEAYNNYDSYGFNAVDNYDTHTGDNETFKNYFCYYDRALADAAPTFEDVPSFKNWFARWKTQVQSVTKCVQERIYLSEMNNYEYYRNTYRQHF